MGDVELPSSFLPSLATVIQAAPGGQISDALRRLHTIYAFSDNQSLDDLRADSFERTLVIKWLTGLIARLSGASLHEDLLPDATRLLATCSGNAGQLSTSRLFTFESPCGQISVRLKDSPYDSSEDAGIGLGLQTWGSASVLSAKMAKSSATFFPDGPLRVLELGAGTGLVSLVARTILGARIDAHVVASDYHPSVLASLRSNITLNNLPSIEVLPLDWSQFSSPSPSPPPIPPFDVILAADVVYEPTHAALIHSCVNHLLAKTGTFHLVLPLRRTHDFETDAVSQAFPVSGNRDQLVSLLIKEMEHEEVTYRVYEIGRRSKE